MVSNPVQNINYFIKRRPPLVIFLLCLVAMAVCTFYFAFKIESEEKTIDIDKKHDWLQLTKHFNKLKTCLIPTSEATNELKNKPLEEKFSVLTKLTMENSDLLQRFSEVKGRFTLEDWYPTACDIDERTLPEFLEIYFKVPKRIAKNETVNICAEVKGPAQILPIFAKPNCALEQDAAQTKNADGFLSTFLPRNFDAEFCQKGESAKIAFSLEQNEISNYIDDDVRIRIYTHLMWCSYILVFFIFCIILYAIFYKDSEMKKEIGLRLL